MPSYSYLMIDKYGKEKKGTMEAVDESKVMAALKADGNIPVSVSLQNLMSKDIELTIGNPVKPRDLSVFCRQFVSILSAGVSIVAALDILSEQTGNKVLAKSVKAVQVAVEKGETLADAMRTEAKTFPAILIQMVEAGENSGNLEFAFLRMAVHFEKSYKIKAQIKKAMIYPVVVGVVAIAVLFLMLIIVIPNFVEMFNSINTELPFMTRAVVGLSNFVRRRWYILVLIVIAFIFSIQVYKKTETGSYLFGQLSLKTPFFGDLSIKSFSSRYARTLSTLLSAGIPMIEALNITAGTMSNPVTKEVLLKAKEGIEKGLSLSGCIKSSKIFPPMVVHMTKVGEETGNIENMLDKLANYYDEEVEIATDSIMAVMEPMIIVVLSLIVGILIMAIMQPMISMYNSLNNL